MRQIQPGVLIAVLALSGTALADEPPVVQSSSDTYSELEDLSLRRDIADLGLGYGLGLSDHDQGDSTEIPYASYREGSSGGYVNFGSPATGSFLQPNAQKEADPLFESLILGFGWRPDVIRATDDSHKPGLAAEDGNPELIGLRADLTASLREHNDNEGATSAWRVSGMLGSTSLSLVSPDEGGPDSSDPGSKGLLWDVGVGWSSGGVSVNAGYLSGLSLEGPDGEESSFAVLSLGADYAIFPGLSVYGEFNMVDNPSDPISDGYGTVIVVGTGVSF